MIMLPPGNNIIVLFLYINAKCGSLWGAAGELTDSNLFRSNFDSLLLKIFYFKDLSIILFIILNLLEFIIHY